MMMISTKLYLCTFLFIEDIRLTYSRVGVRECVVGARACVRARRAAWAPGWGPPTGTRRPPRGPLGGYYPVLLALRTDPYVVLP